MTEMSKFGWKQCPSEKVECKILLPSNEASGLACGAMERLGGVPTLGLTPLGLGEEGFSGTAKVSSVSELLFEIDDFSADCI